MVVGIGAQQSCDIDRDVLAIRSIGWVIGIPNSRVHQWVWHRHPGRVSRELSGSRDDHGPKWLEDDVVVATTRRLVRPVVESLGERGLSTRPSDTTIPTHPIPLVPVMEIG